MAAPTREQAIELIKRYEPILYLHPDEQFVPIKPEEYVQHCALWNSQPASSDKNDWGKRPDNGDFPRSPLIPRNGISINPADDLEGAPDKNSVNKWYLGHATTDARRPYLSSDKSRELFLDFGGWEDGDRVDSETQNSSSNKQAIIDRISSEPWVKDSKYWYYAEVDNLDSLTNVISMVKEKHRIDASLIWDLLTQKAHIIWYYFFYPYHEEVTRHCSDIIGKRMDGSYEGDWTAVAVIVRDPAFGKSEGQNPAFVGMSIKERGMAETPERLRPQMFIVPWEETAHVGRHMKVYVAKNSHNNYRMEGPKNPPSTNVSSFTCETVSKANDEIQKQIDNLKDEVEDFKDKAVTVAKIIAGCGFFGPVGCIVGGLAAVGEALCSDSDGSSEPVNNRAEQQSERDYPPEENEYGIIISPSDFVSTLPDRVYAKEVVPWTGVPDLKLIEGSQIWWKYKGRWGVRVQNDNYDRRGGTTFPNFKEMFLVNLLINLSEE